MQPEAPADQFAYLLELDASHRRSRDERLNEFVKAPPAFRGRRPIARLDQKEAFDSRYVRTAVQERVERLLGGGESGPAMRLTVTSGLIRGDGARQDSAWRSDGVACQLVRVMGRCFDMAVTAYRGLPHSLSFVVGDR